MALLGKRKTKKKKPAKKQTCKVVRNKKTGRKKKVCTPAKKKPTTAKKPAAKPKLPAPSAAAPPVAKTAPAPSPAALAAPAAAPAPAPAPTPELPPTPPQPRPELPAPPTPVHGTLNAQDAERLLTRAGFGPRPGDVDKLTGMDARAAVQGLTQVIGPAPLTGPEPRDQRGNPIDRNNVWGHDHLWWLDRMVRSEHQLTERMTLVWHDWFATTNDDVGNQRLMLGQNEVLRTHALGSFQDLALALTKDPAMLIFLNGIDNVKGRPNENYARELMELFTLGADRGAYTEADVRELARCLTGWRADWSDAQGMHNFRFDPKRQDTGSKTLWAGTPYERRGAFGWEDAVKLCLEHPFHRSFFVRKLWSYFVPTAPDAATQAALEGLYWNSGYQIRPVVEAILLHPAFYDRAAPLVSPPVVWTAAMLRARGRVIDTDAWSWRAMQCGQKLFFPPNVSGWNDQGWLDTATLKGRWGAAYEILGAAYANPSQPYSKTETPEEALAAALQFWGNPTISEETRAELLRYAAAAIPAVLPEWQKSQIRAERQNGLRHLIATCPDAYLS